MGKKRIILILTVLAMIFSLCACSSATAQSTAQPTSTPEAAPAPTATAEPAPAAEAEAPQENKSKTIIVYFSRTGEQYDVGVIEKGNTAIVVDMIAQATGADLYEILPADDHYPMTYNALIDVALQEQRDRARPAIAGELPDLSGYDTIFFGSPVWWGDWPMIYYTFFESVPLSGKTLIPFTTHAGSGLSGFDRSLAAQYPDCTVAKGLAVAGTDAQNHQDKVQTAVTNWLTELGF